ncbi:MAG: TlyA family RNA methyltransferase, partial [Oscillospiraceae bacterium]
LRTDERVVNMERTNFRYVTFDNIGEKIDFASVDVSFISLKKILPVMYNLLKDDGSSICLIKPQFEAGRDKVGKKGVVRELSTHKEVVSTILSFAVSSGFSVLGLDYSPIKGPEGNIEYLMYIKKTSEVKETIINIDSIVESSHNCL